MILIESGLKDQVHWVQNKLIERKNELYLNKKYTLQIRLFAECILIFDYLQFSFEINPFSIKKSRATSSTEFPSTST